jgi:hypothetical protein
MPLVGTSNAGGQFSAAVDTFTGSGVGTPVELQNCDVTVQVLGTATAINARVQRSTAYPGADGSLGNWGPVDDAITGDLTSGLNALVYVESDHAWWRISVTGVTGGNMTSSISGKRPPST